MTCNGVQWYAMVCNGAMVSNGVQRRAKSVQTCAMVCNVVQKCATMCSGVQWYAMVWCAQVCNSVQWRYDTGHGPGTRPLSAVECQPPLRSLCLCQPCLTFACLSRAAAKCAIGRNVCKGELRNGVQECAVEHGSVGKKRQEWLGNAMEHV